MMQAKLCLHICNLFSQYFQTACSSTLNVCFPSKAYNCLFRSIFSITILCRSILSWISLVFFPWFFLTANDRKYTVLCMSLFMISWEVLGAEELSNSNNARQQRYTIQLSSEWVIYVKGFIVFLLGHSMKLKLASHPMEGVPIRHNHLFLPAVDKVDDDSFLLPSIKSPWFLTTPTKCLARLNLQDWKKTEK